MSRNLAVDAAREIVARSQEALQVDLFGPGAVSPDRLQWLREHGYITDAQAGISVPLPGGGAVDPWAMALLIATLITQASQRRARQMRRWPLDRWAEEVEEHIERSRPAAREVKPGLPSPETVVPEVLDPTPRPRPPAEIVDVPHTQTWAEPSESGRPPLPPPPNDAAAQGPLIPSPPPGLGPAQREAWIQARTRAGEFARGLGNRVSADMETLVAEVWDEESVVGPVDEDLRLEAREAIREETADAIAHGRTADELARRLAHRTGDWARDWKRIAATELQGAYSDGVVIDALRYDGEDARVARIPEPGACKQCRAHYLDDNGKPRIFRVADLLENGTNVGKPSAQWLPTIWPLHPNCACATERIPKGLTFNDEWELVPLKEAA